MTWTYADLKTNVASYLARPDLTASIVTFIELAEDRVSHDLRVADMETTADLTINGQFVAKPDGYLEGRRIYLSGSPNIKVNFMSTDNFWSKYLSSTAGQPKAFTIDGSNLVFGPAPETSYTGKLLYWKRYDALSADADTNWILSNARGLYLYGALLEAAPFIRNDPRLAIWSGMFDNILDRANQAAVREQHSGGVLVSHPDFAPV